MIQTAVPEVATVLQLLRQLHWQQQIIYTKTAELAYKVLFDEFSPVYLQIPLSVHKPTRHFRYVECGSFVTN